MFQLMLYYYNNLIQFTIILYCIQIYIRNFAANKTIDR